MKIVLSTAPVQRKMFFFPKIGVYFYEVPNLG